MTSPTSRIPTWATDATVPLGYTDEGLATREEPSEAEKARGYIGDRPPSASFDNWLLGGLCDWLKFLAPLRMRSWRRDASYISTPSSALCDANPTSASYHGSWFLPLSDGTYFRLAAWPGVSVNGQISGASNYTTGSGLKMTNAVQSGVFTFTGIYRVSGSGDTIVLRYNQYNATADVLTLQAGTYVPTFVAVEGNTVVAVPAQYAGWITGAKFWVSLNAGSTWTEYTITDSDAGRTVRCVEIKDGNIVLVFATSNVVTFVNRTTGAQIYQTTVGSAGAAGLAYFSGAWHILIQGTGIIARHYGSYWSEIARVSNAPPVSIYNSDDFGNYVGNCLASDGGSCIAAATQQDHIGAGVATSSDGGVNWSYDILVGCLTLTRKPTFVCLSHSEGQFIAIISGPNIADDAKTFTSVFRTLTL